jgi:hypothetical protein
MALASPMTRYTGMNSWFMIVSVFQAPPKGPNQPYDPLY